MSDTLSLVLISSFGSIGLAIVIVILIIHNLDKYERLMSYLFYGLAFINRKWIYQKAATDIQASINSASRKINKHGLNVFPHAMKVEFVKNASEVETFIRKGEVIVKLGKNKGHEQDIVVSTLAYVKKDLVPKTRTYVDNMMMQATDYTVTKDMLSSMRRDNAVSWFLQNCFEPELQRVNKLRGDCIVLEEISKIGFFYNIFINQLSLLGEKIFPAVPTVAIKNEVRAFSEFLHNIAIRPSGEEVNLDFAKTRIRVKVMLVAKGETKARGTIDYGRRVKEARSQRIEYIYVCAWGEENSRFAKTIVEEQGTRGLASVISTNAYRRVFDAGPSVNAICIVCAMNLVGSPGHGIDNPEVLTQLLEKHVEEVREGKIDIVSVARQPGVQCKVIVKALVGDIDAVDCIQKSIKNESISSILASERIDVIEWKEDIKEMIISSIALNREDVYNIKLENKSKQAYVEVDNRRVSAAIGRDGVNVKLSRMLTGWYVNIERKDK